MSAVIFNGSFVKALKNFLKFPSGMSILTGTADPSSSAQSAPAGSLYLSTNGEVYIKQDAGNTTNWKKIVVQG